jgi:hypothetical protein
MNAKDLFTALKEFWPFILVLGSVLYGVKKNFEVFDWFGYRRLAKLKNIESYTESSELKKFLKRLKEEEAFRAATRINAEGKLEKMIDLIERSRGKLKLFTIRKAQMFFTSDSTAIEIRDFTIRDRFEAWGSVVVAGLASLIGSLLFFVGLDLSFKRLAANGSVDALVWAFGALVILAFTSLIAVFLMQPGVSYTAAKKVKTYLAKERENA